MARTRLPSEEIVGRPKPKDASYRDQILAGHVKSDGSFCGRTNPSERWLIPAFTRLQKDGMLRMGIGLSFGARRGKKDGIWYLTERGEKEAVIARERVDAAKSATRAWSEDLVRAYKERSRPENEPSGEDEAPSP